MAARVLCAPSRMRPTPSFLADLRDDNGPFVPFFGQPARSTVFPASPRPHDGYPALCGARIPPSGRAFPAFASCLSQCRKTNNSAADILVATQALQRQYEAFIREAPEQWMWAHRKWD